VARARRTDRCGAAGMQYVNVPMTGLTPPTAARKLARSWDCSPKTSNRRAPYLYTASEERPDWSRYCRLSPSSMIAGTTIRALKEALSQGQMSFFQFPRQNYIRTYQPTNDLRRVVVSQQLRLVWRPRPLVRARRHLKSARGSLSRSRSASLRPLQPCAGGTND